MPNRCVVRGCSNVANAAEGISLHFIPSAGDERPKAKKRQKQWVDFVRNKRAKWEPIPAFVPHILLRRISMICSPPPD